MILLEAIGESEGWGSEGSERRKLLEYGATGGGQTYLRTSVVCRLGTERTHPFDYRVRPWSLWRDCERSVKLG